MIERAELEKIAELAVRHDLIVVSDEVYSRLVYGDEHACIAAMPGMRERTILADGFSKAYAMTGWRVGYCGRAAALPRSDPQGSPVRDHVRRDDEPGRRARGRCCMARTTCARWSPATTSAARLIVAGLNSIGLTCYEPKGAFYAFPSVAATGLTSDEFVDKLLAEEHVAVVPGSAFGEAGEGFIRCTYCTARDQLEEAIERMDRFVRKYS